jgi:hypothetical protein
LVSGLAATAAQISAVPGWAFVRWRSVHVRPPPVTDEKACESPVPGPSDVRNATRRSLALEVAMAPDVMLVEGAD